MIPASRTPEGTPNRCPICGKSVRIEPSSFPTMDAPCPHCGHLLWFTGPAKFRAPALAHDLVSARRPQKTNAHDEERRLSKSQRIVWVLIAAISTCIVGMNDGLIVT